MDTFANACVRKLFTFFFFQAEDGIRDHCVTGVQTCALPISTPAATSPTASGPTSAARCSTSSSTAPTPRPGCSTTTWSPPRRSEERRVGKECRSRWSAYHLKKNDESKLRDRRHELR